MTKFDTHPIMEAENAYSILRSLVPRDNNEELFIEKVKDMLHKFRTGQLNILNHI